MLYLLALVTKTLAVACDETQLMTAFTTCQHGRQKGNNLFIKSYSTFLSRR